MWEGGRESGGKLSGALSLSLMEWLESWKGQNQQQVVLNFLFSPLFQVIAMFTDFDVPRQCIVLPAQ